MAESSISKTIASPCISVCALDEEDVCTACFRDLDEIAQWSSLDNEQKLAVLRRCQARSRARFGSFGQ